MYVRVCAKVCVKHLIAKEGGNKGDSKVMNEFAWLAVCVCTCVYVRVHVSVRVYILYVSLTVF